MEFNHRATSIVSLCLLAARCSGLGALALAGGALAGCAVLASASGNALALTSGAHALATVLALARVCAAARLLAGAAATAVQVSSGHTDDGDHTGGDQTILNVLVGLNTGETSNEQNRVKHT